MGTDKVNDQREDITSVLHQVKYILQDIREILEEAKNDIKLLGEAKTEVTSGRQAVTFTPRTC